VALPIGWILVLNENQSEIRYLATQCSPPASFPGAHHVRPAMFSVSLVRDPEPAPAVVHRLGDTRAEGSLASTAAWIP
jgi:hypothetical protein